MATTSVRTLLVDDSPDFVESAARFLAVDSQIEIIGCVLSGAEALKEISRLQPDLVLLDLAMPGMNGLETTRLIKAQPAPPRVIILTLYDDDEYRAEAQAAHADGFVAKTAFAVEMLPLIHTIFA